MKKVILVLILTVSCFRETGPKGVLKNYINKRFSSDFSPSQVEEFLTNDLYQQIWGNQVERNSKKRRLKKVKFISENCANETCHITYDISYQESASNNKFDSVEVRKVAKLVYLEEGWRISSTMNIKTYLDLKKQISP